MINTEPSLAIAQRSLRDPSVTYPLFPVISTGCPQTSTEDVQYPLALVYDYGRFDKSLFDQSPLPGLERWQPLLPPLAEGLSMGEGGTPLVSAPKVAEWAGFEVSSTSRMRAGIRPPATRIALIYVRSVRQNSAARRV
ncbi:MAG: hypothetical protein R3C44_12315 [Chloroflexota bacterium]